MDACQSHGNKLHCEAEPRVNITTAKINKTGGITNTWSLLNSESALLSYVMNWNLVGGVLRFTLPVVLLPATMWAAIKYMDGRAFELESRCETWLSNAWTAGLSN